MTTRERLETIAELLESVSEHVRMLASEIPVPGTAQEFADVIDCAARPSGGSNMATYRKARHMTQGELAERLGVGRTTVTMWETGANMPPTKYLVAIAEALGCTVDELLKPESA